MAPIYSRVMSQHRLDEYNSQKASFDWLARLPPSYQNLFFGNGLVNAAEPEPEPDYEPPEHFEYQHPYHQPSYDSFPPPYDSSWEFQGTLEADFLDNDHYVPYDSPIVFSREDQTNSFVGTYHGYVFEISEDWTNIRVPDQQDTSRHLEEVDTDLSEASTTINISEGSDPSPFEHLQTPSGSNEPPPYTESSEPLPSAHADKSRPSPAPLESRAPLATTEEKEPAFQYIKTPSGASTTNKGRKNRKTKRRKGKGQPRKVKNKKKGTVASQNAKTITDTSAASSDLAEAQPGRADSASVSSASLSSSGPSKRRINKREKSKLAKCQARAAAARNSDNERSSEAPTEASTQPSPANADSSVVAETSRAIEAQTTSPDAQDPWEREEDPAPAQQQEYTGPCIVDTERWRQRCLERLAAEQAAQAGQQDQEEQQQEEFRRWQASYQRRQRAQQADSTAMPQGSSSPSATPSEVVSPWSAVPSSSAPPHGQQFGLPPSSSQALYRCGYWSSCGTHVPWWYQLEPEGTYQPHGCCCFHAPGGCCLCLHAAQKVMVRPDIEATFAALESSQDRVFAPSFTEPSQSGQSPHLQSAFTTTPPHQHLSLLSSAPPSSLTITSLSLASQPPTSPSSQLAFDHPAVTMTTIPTSPMLSAGADSPSAASTVKGAPASGAAKQAPSTSSPLPAKKTVVHRVIPVIPLRAHPIRRPEREARDTSRAESITPSSAEEAIDMSVEAAKVTSQGEFAPSVASLFEHARQSRPVSPPAIHIHPGSTHSRRESQEVAQVVDPAEESKAARAFEPEGLTVEKIRLSASPVEPDLRSPSLYFDAKQQMSSSPAQSFGSNNSSPKKSCLKTKPSTPSPPGASPPRSSVRFSDGTSPGHSPDSKDGSPVASHKPRNRRSSGASSRPSTKDTVEHVQSLWRDPTFVDLQIVLTPDPAINEPMFTDVKPTVFTVHKNIVSASPFLRQVLEFKSPREGNVSVINAQAGPRFCSAYAFDRALSTLYGKEFVTTKTLRGVALNSLGLPDDNGTGTYDWSIDLLQVRFALCYASAGAFLACREITARGIEMALDLLSWETAEAILAFAMTARGWTITCPDIVNSPAGSPRSDSSRAHGLGNAALGDFEYVWAEMAKHAALQFFAKNIQPEFKLYERAQAAHTPTRIPPPIWTLPNSLLSNPRLEYVRYGNMPSFVDRRPSRPDILVLSAMLITLPYNIFMTLVDIMRTHGVMTVGLLKEVVEKREERRLHALRMYHRRTWAPGEIYQPALDELGYREYLSGDPNELKNKAATIATASVQRVSVGLTVPNMNLLVPRPLRQSDLALPGPSTSQAQESTATTASQDVSDMGSGEGAPERGRQRHRKKKKKNKGKKK